MNTTAGRFRRQHQATSPRPSPLPFVQLPPASSRTGRPTVLTDLVANKILAALARGAYRETAAKLAGIHPEQLSYWMRRGGEPFETFQHCVRQAEGIAEMRLIELVVSQAAEQPKYALEFLARRFPQRWTKTVAILETPPDPAR